MERSKSPIVETLKEKKESENRSNTEWRSEEPTWLTERIDKEDSSINDSDSDGKTSTTENKVAESENEVDTSSHNPPSKKKTKEELKEEESRTIFVGNLPPTITRRALAAIFKSCGNVLSARLRSQAVTGVKLPPEQAGNQVRCMCSYVCQLTCSMH